MTNTTFNQRQPQKQSTFLKSNPVLRKVTNTAERADSTSCATYKGILIKTLYFPATTVVGFVLFLFLSPMLAFGQHIQSGFFGFYIPQIMFVGVAAIVGLITPFIAIFASRTTPITGTLYTLSQGILIAAISVFYNGAYSGLIMWAAVITLVIVFTMLLLYTSGKIKATEKFKSVTLALLLLHIYNNSVYLDSMIDRTGQINKYLVENGVTVNQISIHAINLEEYFLRKVGA